MTSASPDQPSGAPKAAGTGRQQDSTPRAPSRLRVLAGQAWSLVAVPLISIFLALVVGAVVIVLTSSLGTEGQFDLELPFRAYGALFQGSLGSESGRVTMLVQAAPLILAGLGVGLGFKAGLFNIGGRGQFLLGAVFSVIAAIMVADFGPWVAIPVALIVGALAGAAWGFIPGALKAYTGAHEVVTTIMLNFVAASLVSWMISGPLRQARSPQPVTPDVGGAALPILFGRDGHLGILIAFAAVPIIWFLLYRMTLGFEIRAVGANPDASRYAGMRPRRLVMLTMSLAGLLVGLAGAINMLGINHRMNATFSSTVGFDAITVALLGRSHPVGIMLAALLFGLMRAGSSLMQIQAGVPSELVDLVQAVILFFLVASPVVSRVLRLRGVKQDIGTTDTITRSYGSEGIR